MNIFLDILDGTGEEYEQYLRNRKERKNINKGKSIREAENSTNETYDNISE